MQETWYTLLHHVAKKLHRCVSCCCIPLVWTDNLRYSSEMSLVVWMLPHVALHVVCLWKAFTNWKSWGSNSRTRQNCYAMRTFPDLFIQAFTIQTESACSGSVDRSEYKECQLYETPLAPTVPSSLCAPHADCGSTLRRTGSARTSGEQHSPSCGRTSQCSLQISEQHVNIWHN
jgi:hypothetical protein